MPTKREYLESKITSDLSNGREMHDYLIRVVSKYGLRDAEDIVQEAYIGMMISAESYNRPFNNLPFREDSDFRAWATKITVNKAIDNLRKKRRRKEICEHLMLGDPEIYNLLELIVQPEDETLHPDSIASINGTVNGLNTKTRELIKRAYFSDDSYKEISLLLEIPPGTVKSRLHSARRLLSKVPALQEIWADR